MKMGRTMDTRYGEADAPSLQRYLEELQKYTPLSREEEGVAVQRAREGDREAAERLVTANLRFVVSVAVQYQGRGLPLSELIAEGNIGLLEAAGRFDGSRGYKFISYAVWWIQQAIRKALKRSASVRTPVNRQDDMARIVRHWDRMAQELGRMPSLDEVSGDLEIDRSRAERALLAGLPDVSLESPVDASREKGRSMHDILEAEGAQPDHHAAEQDRRNLIARSLRGCLDGRERMVVRGFYGLDGNGRRTLTDLGAEIGVTRERVRQIRNGALEKLRRRLGRISGTIESSRDLL